MVMEAMAMTLVTAMVIVIALHIATATNITIMDIPLNIPTILMVETGIITVQGMDPLVGDEIEIIGQGDTTSNWLRLSPCSVAFLAKQFPPDPPLPLKRLCHNEGNAMFVILNPSPCVTLTLSEPKGKGLAFWLRVNSVKNLIESII